MSVIWIHEIHVFELEFQGMILAITGASVVVRLGLENLCFRPFSLLPITAKFLNWKLVTWSCKLSKNLCSCICCHVARDEVEMNIEFNLNHCSVFYVFKANNEQQGLETKETKDTYLKKELTGQIGQPTNWLCQFCQAENWLWSILPRSVRKPVCS